MPITLTPITQQAAWPGRSVAASPGSKSQEQMDMFASAQDEPASQ
jgi:hypothetical protein